MNDHESEQRTEFDDNKVEDSMAGLRRPLRDSYATATFSSEHCGLMNNRETTLARRLSAPTDLIRQQYLAEETRETEKQGNGYRKSSDATILGGAVDRTASQCLSVSQPTASDAAAAQKIH
ncbi:hypothetical protein CJU90_6560 [Yarrowia sp. C11]|nr:hypothetical protein CJU90_6560 [Yarrowia sp. C11]KAG5371260.1 hypothetical protein CKK34_1400 [Yarrowia sp. E02]